MTKKTAAGFVLAVLLAVIAMILFSAYRSSQAYRKAKAAIQWDCSVTCAKESTADSYVITYSGTKVVSQTGALTVQNPNHFAITVHLLCAGEPEAVSDPISSGGVYSFLQAVPEKDYTVGIRADAAAGTPIKVLVYDGKDTEPYTG